MCSVILWLESFEMNGYEIECCVKCKKISYNAYLHTSLLDISVIYCRQHRKCTLKITSEF